MMTLDEFERINDALICILLTLAPVIHEPYVLDRFNDLQRQCFIDLATNGTVPQA